MTSFNPIRSKPVKYKPLAKMNALVAILPLLLVVAQAFKLEHGNLLDIHSLGNLDLSLKGHDSLSLGGIGGLSLGGHKGLDIIELESGANSFGLGGHGGVLADQALQGGYSHGAEVFHKAHQPKVIEVVKHVPQVIKELKFIPPPVPVVKHVTYFKSSSLGGHGGQQLGGYGHGGVSRGISGQFIHFGGLGHQGGQHKVQAHHGGNGYPIAISGHLPFGHHGSHY